MPLLVFDAKLLFFDHIHKVLFGPFLRNVCVCPEIVVLLHPFLASVYAQKARTFLVHALWS